MSDVAGLMVLETNSGGAFLGGGQVVKDYSQKMAEAIDEKIKSILDERYNFVLDTLREYSVAIENMTSELLDKEVIEGSKVREIIEEFETSNNKESRLAHVDVVSKEEEGKVSY
jgi:cell division protease FtsH